MKVLQCFILCCITYLVSGQHQNGPTTTPVPILKQINRQNDDGSYSYGYEAADGSFKIETKYPNGDVAGKYGYVDVNGEQREISYGASSKRGFEPQGNGIVVPPPSLNEPTNDLKEGDEDDGQYREDPKIYEDPKYNSKYKKPIGHVAFRQPSQPIYKQPTSVAFASTPSPIFQTQYDTKPSSIFQSQITPAHQYQQVASTASPQPQYQPQPRLHSFPRFGSENYLSSTYHQQPQFSYQAVTPQSYQKQAQLASSHFSSQAQPQFQQSQPQYQPQSQFSSFPQFQQTEPQYPQQYQQPYYNNPHQNYNPFAGHPAQNFDPNTGSYTIDFTG